MHTSLRIDSVGVKFTKWFNLYIVYSHGNIQVRGWGIYRELRCMRLTRKKPDGAIMTWNTTRWGKRGNSTNIHRGRRCKGGGGGGWGFMDLIYSVMQDLREA